MFNSPGSSMFNSPASSMFNSPASSMFRSPGTSLGMCMSSSSGGVQLRSNSMPHCISLLQVSCRAGRSGAGVAAPIPLLGLAAGWSCLELLSGEDLLPGAGAGDPGARPGGGDA